MEVRRSSYLFLACADSGVLDLAAVLRGRLEIVPTQQLVALSALTGEERPVTPDELALLLQIPSERWVTLEEIEGDRDAVDGLAADGLVLTNAEDGPLAELRRREERLSREQWHPYAALNHFLTRWRDADLEIPEDLASIPPDERRAFVERTVAELGPPPPHFHAPIGAKAEVELPLAEHAGGLYQALIARRTTRSFDSSRRLSLEDLAVVLYYSFGCHRYANTAPGLVTLRKTSPSGGGMHPLEVYPLLVHIDGLEPGLYHYDVRRHALRVVKRLGAEEAGDLSVMFTAGQSYFRGVHALFVLTARFYRSFWKYRRHERAYAVLLMDAGHLSQTFQLVCTERGLGAFVTAAINAANIEEHLGLDPFVEGALAVCGCGIPGPRRPEVETESLPYVPRRTVM